RRRHTRFSRDWSSDVCSSDLLADWDSRGGEQLAEWVRALSRAIRHVRSGEGLPELVQRLTGRLEQDSAMSPALRLGASVDLALRSEERRVGKAWRSGWLWDH